MLHNRWFSVCVKFARSDDPTWWADTKEGRQHTLIGINKISVENVNIYNVICFRLFIALKIGV